MVNNKKNKNCKYIFVTGGVLSGVGKGITAASMGAILKAKGYRVTMQKCDPYLNVDAGLLNPVEHGECYVTHDGVETDLDLGHYERFLDFETSKYSITLSGSINKELIEKERAGGFHGKTVQLVPHFTNLVQEKIEKASVDSDIHIVEIGGTVGDYEGLSFLEAIRLFANRVGRRNCLYIDVVYVPWINTSKELKTKPAQNALKDLRGFGIIPDIVCVRTEKPAGREICEKIARFAGIADDAVVNLPDIDSVYDVPFNVLKSGVLNILNDFVNDDSEPDMSRWEDFSRRRAKKYKKTVKIGLVAKYVGNEDTYICVTEALKAAGAWNEVNVLIDWINAEKLGDGDKSELELLKKVDGIVVPGGFGARGAEGKITAATYALENDKPYLGLCLGLQMACVAAARRGGISKANSEEFGAKDGENVVYIMEGQKGKESTGGTMRLGDYPAVLKADSKTAEIYRNAIDKMKSGKVSGTKDWWGTYNKSGAVSTVERHRHRYEVNQKFLKEIEKGGIVVSGTSPDGKLVEFVEAPDCKFFCATQAHPEFKSRPLTVHPLFNEFVKNL
ncbi:CTP synthase [Candidatus Saccharibacteria bacterium]|nr:CTP synthase [Candidatus Saccharibacteria bacterium]MBQ2638454.1 CTP synthase [Candidatus Saccharibacteria bacterium]